MKTPTFTGFITQPVKRQAGIAVLNEANFHYLSINIGKENDEATPPLPLTGRSPASSTSSKYEKKKKDKRTEAF